MNNRLCSHIYLHLKNIYIKKILYTFANLLMEKPDTDLLYQKCEKNT